MSAKTLTRSYPHRVMDEDGKPVEAGVSVALPIDKVLRFEERWGLKPCGDPDEDSGKGAPDTKEAKADK